MFKIDQNYIKGICLVTGTCIGAGMIGVPVKTSPAGLLATLLAFVIIWGIMTASGLLLLEAALSFKDSVNFISMTDSIFGKFGKFIAWLICVFYMYSVMAAYAAGGAGIVNEFYKGLPPYLATTIFIVPFAVMVFFGGTWVSFFNRWLMLGVIVSFVLLCIGIMFMEKNNLQPVSNLFNDGNLNFLFPALPSIVITFGYHEIIPPLTSYLDGKIKPLKNSIIIGSIIPLVVYIIWEILILFLIPRFGKGGLIEMLAYNKNPSSSLIDYIFKYDHNKFISTALSGFLFFALTCCLTGSAWALFDFFADGLKIAKNVKGKIILSIITFIPPIIYTLVFPSGFLKALSVAGGFSAIIMIIYPVLIAMILRYKRKWVAQPSTIKNPEEIQYRAPLNNFVIGIIGLFGILIIILEIMNNL